MTPRTTLILLLLFCILCTTGCTQLFATGNQTPNTSDTSTPPSVAKYQQTLAQPEDSANLVKMDTDVYNLGEVVEFVITNEKTGDLSCTNDPPVVLCPVPEGDRPVGDPDGRGEPGSRQHHKTETR